MVLYEVESLATLASDAYLARLNNPSPWTQKMMPHYRGMNRGLCTVVGSFGFGQGGYAALIRFTPDVAREDSLKRRLLEEKLPLVPSTPGLGSAHFLQRAQAAAMTNEQRIRGADRGVDSALIVMGYDADAVREFAAQLLADDGLLAHGAREVTCARYRVVYSLTASEI